MVSLNSVMNGATSSTPAATPAQTSQQTSVSQATTYKGWAVKDRVLQHGWVQGTRFWGASTLETAQGEYNEAVKAEKEAAAAADKKQEKGSSCSLNPIRWVTGTLSAVWTALSSMLNSILSIFNCGNTSASKEATPAAPKATPATPETKKS